MSLRHLQRFALAHPTPPGYKTVPPSLDTFPYLVKYGNVIFKALSDPTRRRILELLRQRPMSAGELAHHFSISRPAMSAHFAILREAGLVTSKKLGKSVVYELQMSVLEDALLTFAQHFGLELRDRNRARRGHPERQVLNP
jgi:DNA-binding transcriptional ArsR family regulator